MLQKQPFFAEWVLCKTIFLRLESKKMPLERQNPTYREASGVCFIRCHEGITSSRMTVTE
jgi:hypothetical protein